jgi:D-alanyl-lipoteichoic acid acyltransferase DltB (MBOAT superfamily)
MDIVIGLSRLFGFSLPENFDRPMRSANFLELWSRWHITLSQWFKSYLFNPIVKGLVRRWPSPRYTPYFGVLAYFCTFLLMGFWHGTTVVFLIYGLCLGFGVSTNKFYDIALVKRLGRASARSLRANPVYSLFAGAFALAYFAVALTCLWTDFGQLAQLASELGIIGLVAALFVCTFLFSLFRLFLLLAERAVLFLLYHLCVVRQTPDCTGNGL